MIRLRTAIVAGAAAGMLFAAAPRAHAASLSEAKDLYAAANYAAALAMLDGLLQGSSTREDRQGVELYRILCLVAVGRRAEADRAVEAMIERDPLYRPAGDDVPPRIRAAFTDARTRVLPLVIQQDYNAAKGAFDRKEFGAAANAFGRVLKLLAEPDITRAASQPPLADLKTLAEGFRDLSMKAIGPPAPPPASAGPVPGRVYSAEDRRVVPPLTIKQRVPPFRGKISGPREGVIEVVIDARGAVESARMAVPLNGQYDALVLSAAKSWQYQPATLNGVPVKFRKQVRVSLVSTTPQP